jgi:predicted kinase
MATLYMMVGLPASGKSTIAKEYETKIGAKVFSSDAYRSIYGKDETDQTVNNVVFNNLHRDIITALKNGESCVYDATNLNSKKRRNFLKTLPSGVQKICVLVVRDLSQCKEFNSNRERKVPEYVYEKMIRQFEVPYKEEGWDEIIVHNYMTKWNVGHYFFLVGKMNQNNSHHSLSLGDHLIKTCMALPSELKLAGLLHDMGKPFVKKFCNAKGEPTDEAHYYQHDNVGAYMSFHIKCKDNLMLAFLINNHMKPYFNWNEEVYKERWGIDKFEKILQLHNADEAAH